MADAVAALWRSPLHPLICCTALQIWLEMEIGITGGEEDGVDNTGMDQNKLYTQPEQVGRLLPLTLLLWWWSRSTRVRPIASLYPRLSI